MSVFSKIMLSRKAAKEHKGKEAAKAAAAEAKAPYKHTPTHAAVDALSGAPSSWKVEDLPKIKAQHKRRSEMSRTGSYLSTVSYSTQHGSYDNGGPSSLQTPGFPRTSSYNSYTAGPAWFDRQDSHDRDRHYHNDSSTQKRRKGTRGHSYADSGVGPSPLASNVASEDVSPDDTPAVSSGNSTNSNSSDLDTTPQHIRQRIAQPSKPQPTIYADQDIFDRLHTSTTRKLGGAPLYDSPVFAKQQAVATNNVPVAAEAPKQKKQRWSLRGKRNSATLAAM